MVPRPWASRRLAQVPRPRAHRRVPQAAVPQPIPLHLSPRNRSRRPHARESPAQRMRRYALRRRPDKRAAGVWSTWRDRRSPAHSRDNCTKTPRRPAAVHVTGEGSHGVIPLADRAGSPGDRASAPPRQRAQGRAVRGADRSSCTLVDRDARARHSCRPPFHYVDSKKAHDPAQPGVDLVGFTDGKGRTGWCKGRCRQEELRANGSRSQQPPRTGYPGGSVSSAATLNLS
jgi:hypothetical protein